MKLFTTPFTLTLIVVSFCLSVFFLPEARRVSNRFAVDVELKTLSPGHIQLYYDTGSGYREIDSSTVSLIADNKVHHYRLSLPPGKYDHFRLDPIDRQGEITISDLTINEYHGYLLYILGTNSLKGTNQIQSLKSTDDGLVVKTTSGASDPQLCIELSEPITLHLSAIILAFDTIRNTFLIFLSLSALSLLLSFLAPHFRKMVSYATANPLKALCLISVIATLISVFPVVFQGRSFVSPNYGTFLLYDEFPTLPGTSRSDTADLKGSDIGAVMWQHVPFSALQYRSLIRDHEFPLWSRYNSAGSPLLGQGQSMFGDPLHLFVILSQGAAWAWDFKYVLAKYLFSLGLALCVFNLSESFAAAAVIALISPFIGFFIFRVNHPAFFSLCYAPWPLLWLILLGKSLTKKRTALLGLALVLANLALLSSGTVKEAYMLLISVNVLGFLLLICSENSAAFKLRMALQIFAYEVLFIVLSSPLWYSFLTTLKLSYTQYDHPPAAQIPINALIGFFDELFYRPLVASDTVTNPSLNLIFLLGVVYFFSTLHIQLQKKTHVALFIFSLIPLSLAFGFISPGLIESIPFVKNIGHIGNTFSCVLIITASLMAGLGFKTAFSRLKTKEGLTDLIISTVLLFGLLFLYLSYFHGSSSHTPTDISSLINYSLYLGLAALIGLGFLLHYALKRRALTATPLLLISFLCIILLGRFTQFTHFGFEDYTVQPSHRQNFKAPSIAVAKVQGEQYAFPSRAIGFEGNLWSGWSTYLGVEGINAPDALINPRYRELTSAAALSHQWDWRVYLEKSRLTEAKPFLDFLNVRYYLDLRSDQGALSKVLKFDMPADLDVYESPSVWPRAFFTDQVSTYSNAQDLITKLKTSSHVPFAAVDAIDLQASPGLNAFLGKNPAKRTYSPAKSYVLTENSTTFHFIVPDAGVAVLNEVYWPGYPHATLDGYPTKVFRINHIYQAVLVSAGEHTISISYRPKNFTLCVILSLTAIAVLLLTTLGLIFTKDQSSRI